mgnify:CR=1 FL=1
MASCGNKVSGKLLEAVLYFQRSTFTVQEIYLCLDLDRHEQYKDRDLSIIIDSMTGQEAPDAYTIVDGVLYSQVGDKRGSNRLCLCVPESLVHRIMHLLHSHKLAGHPEICKEDCYLYAWIMCHDMSS